ncbi:MAG: hypothetical protein [Bacteriophage sp.]|nr:MAG: hypothetical protein [Bacteriophage sp.]
MCFYLVKLIFVHSFAIEIITNQFFEIMYKTIVTTGLQTASGLTAITAIAPPLSVPTTTELTNGLIALTASIVLQVVRWGVNKFILPIFKKQNL